MINNKGFGLIELIIVMALISIVVLFAIPNFSPYINYVEKSEVKQELKRIEYETKHELLALDMNDWNIVDNIEGEELKKSDKILKAGSGIYREIPVNLVNSSLSGGFYIKDGEVYYSEKNFVSRQPTIDDYPNVVEPEDPKEMVDSVRLNELISFAENFKEEDYIEGWIALKRTLSNAISVRNNKDIAQDKIDRISDLLEDAINNLVEKPLSVEPVWEMADDSDFIWVKEAHGYKVHGQKGVGFFKYVGTKKNVIIPNVIQGHNMTNYRKMFQNNEIIEGIKSTNPNVTSMAYMFMGANLESLDVREINTANTIYFSGMFSNITLNCCLTLDDWNTSKALYLDSMFDGAKMKSLSMKNFNTDNVVYMPYMFRQLKLDELDISSFDLSKVIYLGFMFAETKIDKIYVKNNMAKIRLLNEAFSIGDAIQNKNNIIIKQ